MSLRKKSKKLTCNAGRSLVALCALVRYQRMQSNRCALKRALTRSLFLFFSVRGGVTIGVRIVVLAGLFRIGELASLRGLLMVAERDTGRLKPLR